MGNKENRDSFLKHQRCMLLGATVAVSWLWDLLRSSSRLLTCNIWPMFKWCVCVCLFELLFTQCVTVIREERLAVFALLVKHVALVFKYYTLVGQQVYLASCLSLVVFSC